MLILNVVLVFLEPTPTVGETKQGYTALSFGRTTSDYVQFRPGDMSAFANSFTLCSWIKRLHGASESLVLQYKPGQLVIGGNGYWNYVNRHLNLPGEEFPGTNVWFHYCLSWAAGGTQRVYINGVEVGSMAASSSKLRSGGTLSLGNAISKNSDYTFGGKLYKLNMFSEQLTTSQIREMANYGMCSVIEEKYDTRQLEWERILTKRRYGNVRDLDIDCDNSIIRELQTRLTEAESELRLTKQEFRNTQRRLNR